MGDGEGMGLEKSVSKMSNTQNHTKTGAPTEALTLAGT